MPGKGKFSGFNWHHEYHTVDPQKEKAADCIYLTEDRICRNRSCIKNGEKCFVATHCRYREKEKSETCKSKEKTDSKSTKHGYLVSSCSLPKGCDVYHKKYGMGKFRAFDEEYRLITVEFETQTMKFEYPTAFLKKHLYGNDLVDKRVYMDSLLDE